MSVLRLLKEMIYPHIKQGSCLLAFFVIYFSVLSEAKAEDYTYPPPEDEYQNLSYAKSAYEKRRAYLREKQVQVYRRKPINNGSSVVVSAPVSAASESSAEAMQTISPAAGTPQPLMNEPPIPAPQTRVLIDVPATPPGVTGFTFHRRPVPSYSESGQYPTEPTVSIPQVQVSTPPEVAPPVTAAVSEPIQPLPPVIQEGQPAPLQSSEAVVMPPPPPVNEPQQTVVAVPEAQPVQATSVAEAPSVAAAPETKVYESPNGAMTVKRMTGDELAKHLEERASVATPDPTAVIPVEKETPAVVAEDSKLDPETKKILAELPSLSDTPPSEETVRSVGIDRADPGIDLKKKNVLDEDEAVGVDLNIATPRYDVSYDLEKAYEALIAGKTEEAVRIYEKALEADPENTMALFGLATTYHRLGMLDQARPLYGKLLRIDPYNREALNNFLALVGEESPEAAIVELVKLKNANPDFSPIPAQLSILYQRIGQNENAIDSMVKAATLSPENLVYKYNLAVLYDRNQNVPEAMALYRQLLAAHDKGQELPSPVATIQERLTFLDSNYKG